jgi:hypothetical protein
VQALVDHWWDSGPKTLDLSRLRLWDELRILSEAPVAQPFPSLVVDLWGMWSPGREEMRQRFGERVSFVRRK